MLRMPGSLHEQPNQAKGLQPTTPSGSGGGLDQEEDQTRTEGHGRMLINGNRDPVTAIAHGLQATTPSGSGGGLGQDEDETGIESYGRMLINKQATPGNTPRAGTEGHAAVGNWNLNQPGQFGEADRKKEDTLEEQQAVLKHRDARGGYSPGDGHAFTKECVDENCPTVISGTGSHPEGKRNQPDRVGEADRKKGDRPEEQQAVLKHRDARGGYSPGGGHAFNKECVDDKGIGRVSTKECINENGSEQDP